MHGRQRRIIRERRTMVITSNDLRVGIIFFTNLWFAPHLFARKEANHRLFLDKGECILGIDFASYSLAGRAGIYIVLSVHCKGYEAALGVKHSCFSGLYILFFSLFFFCLRREDTRRKIAGETHSLNWYSAWQRGLLQHFHAIVKCLRHSLWKKCFNDIESEQ